MQTLLPPIPKPDLIDDDWAQIDPLDWDWSGYSPLYSDDELRRQFSCLNDDHKNQIKSRK